MKHLYLLLVIGVLGILAGCEGDEYATPEQSIVVEGWIEDGEFPVVILTHTLVVSEDEQPVDDYSKYLLRWANVRISDGKDTVALTGKYDSRYFPPYIYTTGRMRGKAGNSYTLLVDNGGEKVEAVTYIPQAPVIDSLCVERDAECDTIYQLSLHFPSAADRRNYYQIFVNTSRKSRQFSTSYLGCFSSDVLKSHNEVAVYRPRSFSNKDYKSYFVSGDTVSVKLACIDSVSYAFWDAYEKRLELGENMMFPYTNNLPCNIKGGLGYWCGYGAATRRVELP